MSEVEELLTSIESLSLQLLALVTWLKLGKLPVREMSDERLWLLVRFI
jgi:hypothetical protein